MLFRLIFFSIAVFAFAIVNSDSIRTEEKPNIVVLFADDAGYADFGFQPNARDDMKNLTPHIDSIAKNGVRFTNAYMSGCVCSPSRAGLMTGRYQTRFGHDNNIPPGYLKGGLPLGETFVAKRLQKLNYKTGLVGKWHLGYPEAYQPNQRGFDWFYGCLQGSRSYFPYENPSPHRVFLENTKPTREGGYTTDRIGDAACRFIDQHKDESFFLFVSFTAPHGPLQAKKSDLEKLSHIENQKRRKYAGLVKALDDNVGKILASLKDNGLTERTLVIFTNDNGGQTQTGANNFPLRGKKGTLWEGGTRVPMAMSWPGKIKSGRVIDDPVISLDFLPTFVSLAGGEFHSDWKLDGHDITPLLNGEKTELPQRVLHWRQHGSQGNISCRQGKWKLIHNRRGTESAQPELYDLSQDVSEKHNVAADNPEVVQTLVGKMKAWESEMKEPLWGPGPNSKQGKKKKRKVNDQQKF